MYLALSSQSLTLLIIGVVCIIVLVVFLTRSIYRQPYKQAVSLLTPAEQRFYKALIPAVRNHAIVTFKVRVADVVNVKKGYSKRLFWRHFSQISQKHFDFVLVDKQSFQVLCAIELDDKSHNQKERRKRDKFLNKVMAQTRIPLHRFQVQGYYDSKQIYQVLAGEQ